MPDPIYTGRWRPDLPPATDRHPELLTMTEKAMWDWTKDGGWERLRGTWVNNCTLLMEVPAASDVVVITDSGRECRLGDYWDWPRWRGSMAVGEFYGFAGCGDEFWARTGPGRKEG